MNYAQLMKAMMREVPQLGFLNLWTNDSGSGFEYVSTLYAGRNGGRISSGSGNRMRRSRVLPARTFSDTCACCAMLLRRRILASA